MSSPTQIGQPGSYFLLLALAASAGAGQSANSAVIDVEISPQRKEILYRPAFTDVDVSEKFSDIA